MARKLPREYEPGDPSLSDSERLIVIEVLLSKCLEVQDKQETRIGRLEKATIGLGVLLLSFIGTEGYNLINSLTTGGTP